MAPMWAFVFIMAVELLVVHILVAGLWSQLAALILSVISIAMIAWIITLIRSLKGSPVLVDEDGVTMRLGSKSIRVPAAQIAALLTSWPRERLKQRGVLNLALINYPNVMLELDPPLKGRRRDMTAIAHRLDDPAAFTAAVQRLLEARA